jgi:hypothetical protein
MKSPWLPATILTLLFAAQPAAAVDLAKIDRTIAREPVYQTKTPKYCLLVFGPEAKARLWLVLDGKVLYVDRKGDGDLTGADKRVQLDSRGRFSIGPITLAGGTIQYFGMKVWVWKDDRVQVSLSRKGDYAHRKEESKDSLWQFAGPSNISGRKWVNDAGVHVEEHDFRFGRRRQDAPIVHFDGPLTLKLMDTRLAFVRGDKPTPLHVAVGTPGLGKGTFSQILFLPGDPNATAEIVFPHRDRSARPILVTVELKAPG